MKNAGLIRRNVHYFCRTGSRVVRSNYWGNTTWIYMYIFIHAYISYFEFYWRWPHWNRWTWLSPTIHPSCRSSVITSSQIIAYKKWYSYLKYQNIFAIASRKNGTLNTMVTTMINNALLYASFCGVRSLEDSSETAWLAKLIPVFLHGQSFLHNFLKQDGGITRNNIWFFICNCDRLFNRDMTVFTICDGLYHMWRSLPDVTHLILMKQWASNYCSLTSAAINLNIMWVLKGLIPNKIY